MRKMAKESEQPRRWVRLPEPMWREVDRIAEIDHRPWNNMIEVLLLESFARYRETEKFKITETISGREKNITARRKAE